MRKLIPSMNSKIYLSARNMYGHELHKKSFYLPICSSLSKTDLERILTITKNYFE
jgi:hypothetical protein